MTIDLIAGARPNFVKIAALINAIKISSDTINFRLIHTGQHYDKTLSDSFFQELNLPDPDFNFNIGSGSQAEQTAALMIAYEKILTIESPDLCLVVGDVTSSMACAITAKKMKVRVAHVEAGIRSLDWNMPEEVNRVLIDSITDYFFTTTQRAADFLISQGKNREQIFFVGNTMIDTLLKFKPKFKKPGIWKKFALKPQEFIIVTLHRPSNVDEKNRLKIYISEIAKNSAGLPIIFPAHPRTKRVLDDSGLAIDNLHIISPLSYLEFNFLVERAKAVITDSGGITEETTVLGIPCLTLRDNTERPETVLQGTNELIGTNPSAIAPALKKLFAGKWKQGKIPELWDGKTGKRIMEALNDQIF